jgi:arsenate reductase
MKLVFVCYANAVRSQMAEGYARARAPRGVDVHSAGLIAVGLHPRAVRAMAAIGVDITGQWSKTLAELDPAGFEVVVSLSDRARRPCAAFAPAAEHLHWPILDPVGVRARSEELDEIFAMTRDDIMARVDAFLAERFGAARLAALPPSR